MSFPIPNHNRHPELVSGPIAPPGLEPRGEKWALKRVQGDEGGVL
jgi:hypothetical protein